MRNFLGLHEACWFRPVTGSNTSVPPRTPSRPPSPGPNFCAAFMRLRRIFSPTVPTSRYALRGTSFLSRFRAEVDGHWRNGNPGPVEGRLRNSADAAPDGKWLNRLFQSSFAAAKSVRTRTAITRGRVSVGSVSVELAEKIFGDLSACRVMVIGAGDTSERTARSLLGHGVHSILVANRTLNGRMPWPGNSAAKRCIGSNGRSAPWTWIS